MHIHLHRICSCIDIFWSIYDQLKMKLLSSYAFVHLSTLNTYVDVSTLYFIYFFFFCIVYCVMWSACAYICTSRSITVYRAVDDGETTELILERTEHGDKKDFTQVEFLEIHFVHACGKCTIRARVPRCHGSNVFLKKSNWDNACMYIKYDQHRNLQSILWCLFQLICIVFVYILPLHVYVCMFVCMSHYVCMCVCVCVCVCLCVCVCVCVCVRSTGSMKLRVCWVDSWVWRIGSFHLLWRLRSRGGEAR